MNEEPDDDTLRHAAVELTDDEKAFMREAFDMDVDADSEPTEGEWDDTNTPQSEESEETGDTEEETNEKEETPPAPAAETAPARPASPEPTPPPAPTLPKDGDRAFGDWLYGTAADGQPVVYHPDLEVSFYIDPETGEIPSVSSDDPAIRQAWMLARTEQGVERVELQARQQEARLRFEAAEREANALVTAKKAELATENAALAEKFVATIEETIQEAATALAPQFPGMTHDEAVRVARSKIIPFDLEFARLRAENALLKEQIAAPARPKVDTSKVVGVGGAGVRSRGTGGTTAPKVKDKDQEYLDAYFGED